MCSNMLLLAVATTLCASAFAAAPAGATSGTRLRADDPFASWLHDATISLDQVATIPFAGTNLTVSGLRCSGITIGSISSHHEPAAADASVNVTGIGIACNASWSFVTPLGHQGSGTLAAEIEKSSIAASAVFGDDGSVTIAPCVASIDVKSLKFGGDSIAAAVLKIVEKLFTTKLLALIDDAGAEALCSAPQQLVDKFVTILKTFGLLSPVVIPAESPPPTLSNGTVQWQQVQLVDYLGQSKVKLAQTANKWVQTHIGKGADAQYKINLAKLLPKLSDISLPLPWLNVSLGLDSLTAGGLDTFQDLTIVSADPLEPHSFLSHAAMAAPVAALATSGLNMSAINSSLFMAGPLSLPGVNISLKLTNGSVQLASLVGIAENFMADFTAKELKTQGLGDIARQLVAVILTQAGGDMVPTTFTFALDECADCEEAEQSVEQPLLSSIVDMVNAFVAASISSPALPFGRIPSNALNLVVELFALPMANNLINTTIGTLQEIPVPQPPATNSGSLDYYWVNAVVVTFAFILLSAVYQLVHPHGPGKEGEWSALGSLYSPRIQILGAMWCILGGCLAVWSIIVPVCDVRMHLYTQLTRDTPETEVLDMSLLVYSFPEMIKDFWGSGAYIITVSLLLGSGIMPSLKACIGMIVWTVPLPVAIRGWLLLLFDLMGRFLFINQAFIAIVVTTLNITIEVPGLKAEVRAEPVLGILAGTLDLLIGMLHWSWLIWLQSQTAHSKHSYEVASKNLEARAVAEAVECFQDGPDEALISPADVEASPGLFSSPPLASRSDPAQQEAGTDEEPPAVMNTALDNVGALSNHETIPPWMLSTKQRTASKQVCWVALTLLFLTTACYIAALSQNILEFDLSGLGGHADKSFGVDHSNEVIFTMTGLGFGLPGTNDKPEAAYPISFAYLLLIVFGPLATIASWSVLWIGHFMHKGNVRSVRIVRWLCPYMYSWCGMDVLFVAIFAGALEMNLPTQWIITNQVVAGIKLGEVCSEIKDLTQQECIHIDGKLPAGAYLMLGAAIFSFSLFALTTRTFGHPALANEKFKYGS